MGFRSFFILLIWLFELSKCVLSDGSSCLANRGSDIHELPCIFPFKYVNNVYEQCIWNGRFHSWCATEIDEDGFLLDKNWGYCNRDCPAYENPRSKYLNDSIPGCNTQTYGKKDGQLACGIYLTGVFNFSQAELECEKQGARLPEIYSEEENKIISKFRGEGDLALPIAIGRIEGNKWITSNKGLSYTNFKNPSTVEGCFEMRVKSKKWHEADCSKKLNIICEKVVDILEEEPMQETTVLAPGFFIFNGKPATTYYFHVGLIKNGHKHVFCSGSLLSTIAVLSAAHCFQNMTKDDFKLVVGQFDLSVLGDEQAFHTAKEIIIHKDFNQSNFEYDFAIILLDEPVNISSLVGLVMLPIEKDFSNMSEKIGFVNGWGLNENRQPSIKLQQVEMEFMSNLVCQYFFNNKNVKIPLTGNHICAVSNDKKSRTCNGDNGGGLIYTEDDKHYILGVLSGSVKECQPQFPTLFAKVISNLDWIKENMIPKEKQLIYPDCVANRLTQVVDVPCRFPFTYDGVTHNSCAYNEGKPWCATAVDNDGVLERDHWGYCSKECPKNQLSEQKNPVPGCSSPIYKKGNGFPACAINLEGTFDIFEAEVECEKRGGKLPEIYSEEENNIIANYRDNIKNGIGKIAIGRIDESVWKTSNIYLLYSNFADGSRTTGCFELSPDGNKWVGVDCAEKMNIVCEKLIYNSKKSSCKTITGPQIDHPCIFPFKYNENVFHACTSYGTNKPWCHTRVQGTTGGGYIDEWGFCGDNCPVEETHLPVLEKTCRTVIGRQPGRPCVFPFKWYDNVYNQCTLDGENTPWCATEVDSDGELVFPKDGFCHTDCSWDPIPENLSYLKPDGSMVSLILLPIQLVNKDAVTQCESVKSEMLTFDSEEDFNSFQKAVGLLRTSISKIVKTEDGKLVWETSGKRLTFSKFKNSEDEEIVNGDWCISSFNDAWTLIDCSDRRSIICGKVIS